MVISKIIGGLGNQLFQYAIARRMATDSGQPYAIDTADFSWYRRPFVLDQFQITSQILPLDEAKKYRRFEGRFSLQRSIEYLKPIKMRRYRLESPSDYFAFQRDALIVPSHGDVYLNGYWQNENYFLPIRNALLSEFQLKPEFESSTYHNLLSDIKSGPSIGVHFRRGDDQLLKSEYGAPRIEFYLNGVQRIAELLQVPVTIFVFSNEIAWVKEHFKPTMRTVYIDEAIKLTDPEEFMALANCSHHVISNSTFSWWAAWLNANPSKHIIAPSTWMHGTYPRWKKGPVPLSWERSE